MGKIVFFNTSDNIQEVVAKFFDTLKERDSVKMVRAGLDNAVYIARGLNPRDIDVIVARGNTAIALSKARLPFPVIPILVGTKEIAEAFQEALKLTGKDKPLIGVSGFEQSISNIKALLNLSGIEIRFYPIESMEDICTCAINALRDKVDVMISGTLCTRECLAQGVPAVEMKTSMDSVRLAYNQALEFQKSAMRQRAFSEQAYMLSCYTREILIAIDENGDMIGGNEQAALFLNLPATAMKGIPLFSRYPFDAISTEQISSLALNRSSAIVTHNHKRYALSVTSTSLLNGKESHILRLQSVSSIQRNEQAVRRALSAPSPVPMFSLEELKKNGLFTDETITRILTRVPLSSPLLLSAEPGCGAELLARGIHAAGQRRDMPFADYDCDELACDMNSEELESRAADLFESAHGGTLFLSEVDKLSLRAQLILLSILRSGRISGRPGTAPLPVDVRVIASCSPSIYSRVSAGEFKAELYYLLSQNTVLLPPLCAHKEDTPKIFLFFLSLSFGKPLSSSPITREASDILKAYPWHGNLIQLYSFCRSVTELSTPPQLTAAFLRRRLCQFFVLENGSLLSAQSESAASEDNSPYIVVKNTMISREKLLTVMSKNGGSKSKTAESLGISRTSLWKALKE
ncbi:MAG: PrpR N-terminal domain-containing protein, partial [Oscillospiraceae bacterium]